MIKSFMHCFDVLFPINLGPLTYTLSGLSGRNSATRSCDSGTAEKYTDQGIVLDKNTSPPKGPLKELQIIPGDTCCSQ